MQSSDEDRRLADAVYSAARAYADALVEAANAGLEIDQSIGLHQMVVIGAPGSKYLPEVNISIARVTRGVLVESRPREIRQVA